MIPRPRRPPQSDAATLDKTTTRRAVYGASPAGAGAGRRARLRAAGDDIRRGLARRELWLFLGWRDVRKHYSRSILGPFWLTLSMGVMIAALGLLYSQIFKMEIRDYLPFLAVGLIVWALISGSVTGACSVFSEASEYIRQVRMPYSVHVLKFVWSQLIAFFHNIAIYAVLVLLFRRWPGWEFLAAVPAVGLIALNAAFATLILGPLSARFRDIPMIVASLTQVVFFVTPIIWSAEQITGRTAFIDFNPAYYFVEIVRDPLLGRPIQSGEWLVVLGFTLVHGLVAFGIFARMRTRIAYWI